MYFECKGVGGVIVLLLGLFSWVGSAAPVLADGATRDLPDRYSPGVAFTVSITIDPPDGTVATVLEDSPPNGWTEITNIVPYGSYGSETHTVRWWPFTGDAPVTASYDVTPPEEATGEHCFGPGTVVFEGELEPVEGDACLADTCSGRGDFDGNCDVDLEDYVMFVNCMAGPETPPDPTGATAQKCLDVFDFDEDGDVDIRDMAGLETAFTGSS